MKSFKLVKQIVFILAALASVSMASTTTKTAAAARLTGVYSCTGESVFMGLEQGMVGSTKMTTNLGILNFVNGTFDAFLIQVNNYGTLSAWEQSTSVTGTIKQSAGKTPYDVNVEMSTNGGFVNKYKFVVSEGGAKIDGMSMYDPQSDGGAVLLSPQQGRARRMACRRV